METSLTSDLPKDFLSDLERRFFWWEPVGSQPRSETRILAQAMSMAGFEEMRRLEQTLGCDRLADIMLRVEPGWIDERSWEFWRGRLMRTTGRSIPDAAPSLEKALGAFAVNYRRDPTLPLKAMGFFKDGDLPSLPKADQDLLRAARDRVSNVPEVHLLKGLLPAG